MKCLECLIKDVLSAFPVLKEFLYPLLADLPEVGECEAINRVSLEELNVIGSTTALDNGVALNVIDKKCSQILISSVQVFSLPLGSVQLQLIEGALKDLQSSLEVLLAHQGQS